MKLHVLEALASGIIIGSGQIIKRDTNKGVILLLIFYFVLPTITYLSLLINAKLFPYFLGFAIFSAIILWIYSIMDALIKQ